MHSEKSSAPSCAARCGASVKSFGWSFCSNFLPGDGFECSSSVVFIDKRLGYLQYFLKALALTYPIWMLYSDEV